MRGRFSRDSEEYKVVMEFYDILREYYHTEDNVEYWTAMTNACSELARRHQNGKVRFLAKRLAMCMIDFAEDTKNENNGPNSNGAADR